MTAKYTNLITVPGISGRVVIDADYNWSELGELLAAGNDDEQATFLTYLVCDLQGLGFAGSLQLQYLSDRIKRDQDDEYRIAPIVWFLRELLERLES